MEYLDFDVHIRPGIGRDYPVSVIKSPAGEANTTLHFPFDAAALESQLNRLELAVLKSGTLRRDVVLDAPEKKPVEEFGTQIFDALFTEEVQLAFRRSQDCARTEGKGLRVRLRIDAPDLAALPWEFLYDSATGDYVCLSSETPVVRYLAFSQPPADVTVQPPIAILAMVASPNDRQKLDAQHEVERMQQATAALQDAGLLRIEWMEGSTWRDLQRTLRRGEFHIFHFVGHGGFNHAAGEGVLAFTNDTGDSDLLPAREVGSLLAKRALRLVVLNSCLGARGNATDVFSSTSATLVRRGVPAVVAMQYEISDLAAIEFSRSLYEAIADGMPIDAAVGEARNAVRLSARNSAEWATPVLHMRSPDGVLFKVDKSQIPTRPKPVSARPAPLAAAPPHASAAPASMVAQAPSPASSPGKAATTVPVWELQPGWAFLLLLGSPPAAAGLVYWVLEGKKAAVLWGALLGVVGLSVAMGLLLRKVLGRLWQLTLVILFVSWFLATVAIFVARRAMETWELVPKVMSFSETLVWSCVLSVLGYAVVILLRWRLGSSEA